MLQIASSTRYGGSPRRTVIVFVWSRRILAKTRKFVSLRAPSTTGELYADYVSFGVERRGVILVEKLINNLLIVALRNKFASYYV